MMLRTTTLVLCALVTGCTLMLDVSGAPCSVDADCGELACVDELCVESALESLEGLETETVEEPECKVAADCRPKSAGLVCSAGRCATEAQVPWLCLDEAPPEPDADAGTGSSVIYRVPVVDLNRERLKGLQIVACGRHDVECKDPLTDVLSGDKNGIVEFELPWGFEGFLEFSAEGLIDGRFYFADPLYADSLGSEIIMLAHGTVKLFALTAGVTVDVDELGTVLLRILDCNDEAAEDIVISVTPMEEPTEAFYIDSDIPTNSAEATTAQGRGGVANIPPSIITLNLTRKGEKEPFHTTVLPVRAETLTYTAIRPAPAGLD